MDANSVRTALSYPPLNHIGRAVRLVWIVVAATMIALLAVLPAGTETPIIVIALMSYPAGMLANFFPPVFPVRMEGFPELTIYPLLTVVFGFVQWFVVVPWLLGKVWSAHRNVHVTPAGVAGQHVSRVVLLIGTWLLAEICAMALSIALNDATQAVVRHLNRFTLHLWFDIPGALAAGTAALLFARLFDARESRSWIVALAALFLCASTINAATLRLGAGLLGGRIWPIIDVVIPAALCLLVGLHASRRLPAPTA